MVSKHSAKGEYSYRLHQTFEEARTEWQLVHTDSVFLQENYLTALELAPPSTMQFFYLIIYQNGRAVGKAYFQRIAFVSYKSLKTPRNTLFCKLNQVLHQTLGKIEIKLLVLGNLLLTGQNAFAWNDSYIDKEECIKSIFRFIENMPSGLIKYDVLLAKDFSESDRLKDINGLFEFKVDPAMYLDIPDEWKHFDHYLQALTSKYRVRAKSTAKRLGSVQKKSLSQEEIKTNAELLYQLYDSVAQQQGFNTIKLDPNYFCILKSLLKDDFLLKVYQIDQELIAFYTLIYNKDTMEAYYLGFDQIKNQSKKIYLNILLDFIRDAIDAGVSKIALSRTALEIKSSVGAYPEDKYCYLKHNKKWGNLILPGVVKFFKPKSDWKARHPFRQNKGQ